MAPNLKKTKVKTEMWGVWNYGCGKVLLTASCWRRDWALLLGWSEFGESEDSVRANGTVRGLEKRGLLEGLREVREGIWKGFWGKRGTVMEGKLGRGWTWMRRWREEAIFWRLCVTSQPLIFAIFWLLVFLLVFLFLPFFFSFKWINNYDYNFFF